ncbi:MAG: tetratricopeptide repeat protein [Candidatus Thiodiazotropha sp. (ex Dulcina madagascariensis)]|nr:tetratricopeptide repeat protein [Candidatus Thiodiazotropha sp. (ex Dulcina madagascariensis)]
MPIKIRAVSSLLTLGLVLITGAFCSVVEASTLSQQPISKPASVKQAEAEYVGGEHCASCHAEQNKLWRGSHHDLAMQPATEQTILGNFNDAEFIHFDVTSRFYRDGDRFMVRTDGLDGKLQDFEIKYTFGVTPLQQYLIEFKGGRLQALGIAWDARPKEQGGQRWFHLYPDEHIDHEDELHWTGLNQNWNYMCAECHSTNVKKNYDAKSRRFDTSWSEIDVACEACHGPGLEHIKWADKEEGWQALGKNLGLVIALDERKNVAWPIDSKTGTAVRSESRKSTTEIELCARCHARRGVLSQDYIPGQGFLDAHRPALLTERLYHADGQIQDEVYVYGSFIQSKMFHAGVTCSDCHEPHSLKLRGSTEQVCLQCHAADRFATPKHHFHESGGEGGRCVQCHMPKTNYMVVDPRADHSIRIPRPDLSVSLGTPNACIQCHTDKPNAWAAERFQAWYDNPAKGYQQYAEALHAGRSGAPEAAGLLLELLSREQQPAIARATALSLLGSYLVPQSLQAISDSLNDEDPIVRLGGLTALEALQPNMQFRLAAHLLDDPVRAVRIEAGLMLASMPSDSLDSEQRTRLAKAVDEYVAAQRVNADHPQAQANLGNLYARMGDARKAAAAYREALVLNKRFVPAYLNLADLYRQTGREVDAKRVLGEALALAPDDAGLHHAHGLALVRGKELQRAVEALRRAAELAPENARHAYVYAVALDASGKLTRAIEVLEQVQVLHEYNPEILSALISYCRKAGMTRMAEQYQAQLAELQRRAMGALRANK